MKTLPNDIRQQLNSLKAVKPSDVWLAQEKQRLLSTLNIQAAPKRSLSPVSYVSISSKAFLTRLAWQPVGISLMILGVVVGPSIAAVNAAKGSLPGDALYPVKRSLERARLSLTFSSSKRAELEVDLVATRLHELQRLTKEQAPSPERQQNITLAVEELKKDTATVKTRLDAAKQSSDSSGTKQEVVALAKIVDQKTADYQEALKSAIDDLDSDASKTNGNSLSQAINSVQEVTINALDILVDDAASDQPTLSNDELKARVEKQLAATQQAIKSFRSQIEALRPLPTADDVVTITVPNPDQPLSMMTQIVPKVMPLNPKLEALLKQADTDVTPLIANAQDLLKMQSFSAALDALTKANKKIDDLSKSLAAAIAPPEPTPKDTTEQPPVSQPTPAAPEAGKADASNATTPAPASPTPTTDVTPPPATKDAASPTPTTTAPAPTSTATPTTKK